MWRCHTASSARALSDHTARAFADVPTAMMATSTLLFATGLTSDNQPHLFAIDKKTGRRIGKVATPLRGEYGIMTYMHGGKQYIVLSVQGGYVALALP